MSLKIKPMPKSRKEVFQYFLSIETCGRTCFKCNLCNLILRNTFSASALRAHLNKYHPIVFSFRDSYQSFNENKALINLNNNLHYSDFNLAHSPDDNSQENEVIFLHSSADINCLESSEENNKDDEDSNVQCVYTNCSQSSKENKDNNLHCVDTNSLRTSKDSNKENNYNQRLADTNEPQPSDINNPSTSETNNSECSVINETFPLNLDKLKTFESRELQQPRSEETPVTKMLTNMPLSLKDDPQELNSQGKELDSLRLSAVIPSFNIDCKETSVVGKPCKKTTKGRTNRGRLKKGKVEDALYSGENHMLKSRTPTEISKPKKSQKKHIYDSAEDFMDPISKYRAPKRRSNRKRNLRVRVNRSQELMELRSTKSNKSVDENSMLINSNRKESEQVSEKCSAECCLNPFGDNLQWIQCDECDLWLHCICVELDQIDSLQNEDFMCWKCRVNQKDTESIVEDKSVDPITSSSSLLADSPKKERIPKVILTSVSGSEESRYEASTLTTINENANRWTIRFKDDAGEASALTKVYREVDGHDNNLDKYKSAYNEPENACSEMNVTSSDANIIENEEIVSDVTNCSSDEESNITSSIVNYPEKVSSSKRHSNGDNSEVINIKRTVSGFIDNFCLTLSASGTLLTGSFLLMEKDDVVFSKVLVSSRKQLRKFLKTLKPYEIIFKFENSQSNIVNTCLGMQCTNKKFQSSLYIMFCLFKNNREHLQYYVYASTQRNIFYVMMHQLIRGGQVPRFITDVIENYLLPTDLSRLRSMPELKNLSSMTYCDNLDPFV